MYSYTPFEIFAEIIDKLSLTIFQRQKIFQNVKKLHTLKICAKIDTFFIEVQHSKKLFRQNFVNTYSETSHETFAEIIDKLSLTIY